MRASALCPRCGEHAAHCRLAESPTLPAMARLQEGINRHVFGEGLNPLEQEWLAEVINEHLGESGTPGLQPVCHCFKLLHMHVGTLPLLCVCSLSNRNLQQTDLSRVLGPQYCC